MPPDPHAKQAFMQRYKFYMAFENSSLPPVIRRKKSSRQCGRVACLRLLGETRALPKISIRAASSTQTIFRSDEELIEHIVRVDQDEIAVPVNISWSRFFTTTSPTNFLIATGFDFFDRIYADPTPPLATREIPFVQTLEIIEVQAAS